MKKYEIWQTRYNVDIRIKEVEIERETAKCIWVDGRKRAKRSSWENYYDTWEEAHQELEACQNNRVLDLRRELEVANSRLGNVRGMKKPVDNG